MTAAVAAIGSGEAGVDQRWRAHLAALAAVVGGLLLLFHRDAADMIAIWWNDATYNHVLLIPPIVGWLVWQRREELALLRPSAWWAALLVVGAGAFGWLLGEAAGVASARHLGLVLMVQGAVAACLGRAVASGIAFPLFYLLFLVPFGSELVPAMQTLTAEMAMALLGLAGIPAHLDGVFITTPAGYFEVAEACAGVRFLVAMLALGALVANLCFRSWRRRAVFMAAAIVVPILANGVRAFGTIWVAELAGLEFAVGFDHVLYGWIFFAIVIGLLLAVFWRWFDRRPGEPWFDPARIQGPERAGRPTAVAAAALALVALPLAWSGLVAATGTTAPPQEIASPEVAGWQQVSPEGRLWRPTFQGADVVRQARYRDASGRQVDLVLVVFARQREGAELVGFGQGTAEGWAWTAPAPAPPNGRAERVASHGRVREVVSFYRVGQSLTGSGMRVKIETMKARLLGRPQRAVAVLVSAEAPGAGVSARPQIDSFIAALGPIDRLADRAAGAR